MTALRFCQLTLVGLAAFFLLLVVFGNVTDYGTNRQFVQHVLSMDTIFPGGATRWRAISNPAAQRAGYDLIILWEAASCGVIAAGWARLWRQRRAAAAQWEGAKGLACAGLTMSLALWLGGFLCVGGEWFEMWQSRNWSGVEAAFRLFAVMALILLVLLQREAGGAAGE